MRAKIPWARVLAEGTAIVVSILLAFGIQAGWERRQEGDDASRALEALRQDFTANRDTLSLLVSDHTLWADELAWFYATPLEEHLASPRSDSIAERVLASFVLQITYDPTVGSLETLLEQLWRSDAWAGHAPILELWRGSYVSELESLLRLTDSVLALIDAR